MPDDRGAIKGCYSWFKDNNSESNSQHTIDEVLDVAVVIVGSKIIILKAIHNLAELQIWEECVVIVGSKIIILKAIHNNGKISLQAVKVVIVGSKIIILKAIHNYSRDTLYNL